MDSLDSRAAYRALPAIGRVAGPSRHDRCGHVRGSRGRFTGRHADTEPRRRDHVLDLPLLALLVSMAEPGTAWQGIQRVVEMGADGRIAGDVRRRHTVDEPDDAPAADAGETRRMALRLRFLSA